MRMAVPPPPAASPSALRASGAAAPFAASLIGRLPMGAIGLVFILRTHEITGSFAAGGAATAVYALSLGLVAHARAADRPQGPDARAARRGFLQAFALMASPRSPARGAPVILALAAVIGASQPPLGATVRALWARDLDRTRATSSYAASPPCSRGSTSPARC